MNKALKAASAIALVVAAIALVIIAVWKLPGRIETLRESSFTLYVTVKYIVMAVMVAVILLSWQLARRIYPRKDGKKSTPDWFNGIALLASFVGGDILREFSTLSPEVNFWLNIGILAACLAASSLIRKWIHKKKQTNHNNEVPS